MAKSMTGFGRGESQTPFGRCTVELKSVNHRYQEIVIRMSKEYSSWEERVRSLIQESISRGRVDVYITIEDDREREIKVTPNLALAKAYQAAFTAISRELNQPAKLDINRLILLDDVLKIEEVEGDIEGLWPMVEEALREALGRHLAMRTAEGNRLADDLLKRAEEVRKILDIIEKRSPAVVAEYQEKLQKRLAEYFPALPIDENRLAMEVALFADRCSVTEEIVRLRSHLAELAAILPGEQPSGRKADFLIQEMNREINTIGSKSADREIARAVVDIKSELEKIREQVQNLE